MKNPWLLPALVLTISPLRAQTSAARPASVSSWTYTVSKYGVRELSTGVRTQLPADAAARVRFSCSPKDEKDVHGAISIELSVLDVKQFPTFNFDDFDGPDPLIGSRKLMELEVKGAKGSQKTAVRPAGFYPGETPGGFTFELSALSRAKTSDPKRVLRQLLADGSSLVITVTDSKDPSLKIRVEVPAEGMKAGLKSLLEGLP